jgi:hypothetical protein
MSTAQPGPRSRHGCPEPGTPWLGGFTTASTSGDGPRPNLPRVGVGAVAIPALTAGNAPADRSEPVDQDVATGHARAAMARPQLTGADLYDWMALRRVSAGGIAKVNDHWLERGRRIPGYIAEALTALCDTGVVTLAEVDVWGMRRTVLTDTGTVRYDQLNRQQQTAQHPAGQSPPELTWLADHPHVRNVVQSVWDTLNGLDESGDASGVVAALRRVLAHHQSTPAGRCRACRRWRWRRRRFPCIVWHQAHTELQGRCPRRLLPQWWP